MAEVAALGAVGGTAVEVGKEANRQLRRAWRKAKWGELTRFDFEAVFMRVLWAEGILFVGKIVLDNYASNCMILFHLRHPDFLLIDILEGIATIPQTISRVFSPQLAESVNKINAFLFDPANAAEAAAWKAEVESDPLFQLAYLVDKYYGSLVILVLLVMLFLESRRCAKIKKMQMVKR